MKIKATAVDQVESALNAVQGQRTARVLTGREVQAEAEEAEKRMESLGIPQSHRKGARYIINGGSVPHSGYQYRAHSTEITLTRGCEAWFVVEIETRNAKSVGRSGRLLVTEKQAVAAMAAAETVSAVIADSQDSSAA